MKLTPVELIIENKLQTTFSEPIYRHELLLAAHTDAAMVSDDLNLASMYLLTEGKTPEATLIAHILRTGGESNYWLLKDQECIIVQERKLIIPTSPYGPITLRSRQSIDIPPCNLDATTSQALDEIPLWAIQQKSHREALVAEVNDSVVPRFILCSEITPGEEYTIKNGMSSEFSYERTEHYTPERFATHFLKAIENINTRTSKENA